MPIGASESSQERHRIIRRVEVVRGTMTFRMECILAFDYAREVHETRIVPGRVTFDTPEPSLGLASFYPLQQWGNGALTGFTLQEEQSTVFVLREIEAGEGCGVCFSRGLTGVRPTTASATLLSPLGIEGGEISWQ